MNWLQEIVSTDLLMQISLAFSMSLAAIFFKSDFTCGKTSAIPENKEERLKDAHATLL
jgi:hypothetical protein